MARADNWSTPNTHNIKELSSKVLKQGKENRKVV